jgi:uncharacterized membrane protein YfcA
MRVPYAVLGLLLTLRVAAIGAAGVDVTTTAVILHQGGREVNPLLQRQTLLVATAANAGTVAGIYTLEAKHPKWAAALYVAVIGVRGWAVGHNVRYIR